MNPHNVGVIENPDGVGEVGNLRCGDIMYVYIRVGTRNINQNAKCKMQNNGREEYIKDIKFKTLGCVAAVASSSILTELAKGKSLEDAEKINRDDINEALGILPAQKYHCSILSASALKKAIEDYKSKK